MPETPGKFYLTTPIYYVNARPHIGHAYSTIAADVIARRRRLLGDDTFFLTGTDEHGQKVQRSAAAAGIPPQQFADEVSATFQNLWKRMGITNDDFIRTTDERHKRGVQHLWRQLEANGAIYLSSYTGQYCVSDETFVDVPVGASCPTCGRPTETITEENYFFRLSDFQQPLIDLIKNADPQSPLRIRPDTARNEVLSFLRGGLKDLSISRTTFDWGIPVPGNPKHVVYVWLDALANYITAIGYGSDDPADIAKFKRYWPADIHLVGKEITRFHCVYWPAFLLALNPKLQHGPNEPMPQLTAAEHAAWAEKMLPRSVVANGWLLFEESKMSKSRGNVVRTETILDAFGEQVYAKQFPDSTKREQDLFASDVIRYFLLREIPFGQDGSFSFDALITRYNADLANGYGNLVSRTLSMIGKYFDGLIPEMDESVAEEVSSFRKMQETVNFKDGFTSALLGTFERGEFDRFLQGMSIYIGMVDEMLTLTAPWKNKPTEARTTRNRVWALYYAAESIRIITALLYPVMPYATASVWRQLGLGDIEEAARNGELKDLKWGGLKSGTKLGPLAPIFPRADKGLAQIMIDMEAQNNPTTQPKHGDSSPTAQDDTGSREAAVSSAPIPQSEDSVSSALGSSPEPSTGSPTITIDDFARVDLRVAQIVVAERIPKADKLLRLEVDLGPSFNPPRRQILAGIAEYYTPEALIGRKVVIVANLAPRKMRGLESQGMLVAASLGDHGRPSLASFLEDVELGARLR